MLLNRDAYPNLPKWPASFITGVNVTPEQAKEIIFRTDTSVRRPGMMSGNDARFRKRCSTKFNWDELDLRKNAYFRQTLEKSLTTEEAAKSPYEISEQWSNQMGMISTDYVYNSFLSTCYSAGPVGWCNPDGKILFENHNYGKWPSVDEIVEDWKKLVAAFPYLDLVNTLYSDDSCSEVNTPVCSIVVKNGAVEVHAPDLGLHTHVPNMKFSLDMSNLMAGLNGNYSYEKAWPNEWIEEFAQKSTTVMNTVLKAYDE